MKNPLQTVLEIQLLQQLRKSHTHLRKAWSNLRRAQTDFVKNLRRDRILRAEAHRVKAEARRKLRQDQRRIRESIRRERAQRWDQTRRDAHSHLLLGVFFNSLAMWDFLFAARKRKLFPFCMGLLLLSVCAGHFFLDILEHKADDI